MKKKKYLFIEMEEKSGEQEYSQYHIKTVDYHLNNDDEANAVAKNWYGGKSREEDGGYWHLNETVFVRVKKVVELTPSEYAVLNKFI